MRILSLHCDYIRFRPVKKAIPQPEKLSKEEEKSHEIKECLVIFVSVEKTDEKNMAAVTASFVDNVKDIASQVKCDNIVIYPYVHLTSEPSSPQVALKILQDSEAALKKAKFKVARAPFGWYKEFEVKCKGHALAELSRVISAEAGKVEKRKEEEKEAKKTRKKGSEFCKFILVDVEGNEYEINEKNWKKCAIWKKKGEEYERLKIFVRNELEGAQEKEKPAHIKYMRELELLDYCPESDIGHFKWFPKGMLIKKLILDMQERLATEFGAFQIQNPLLYRLSVPAIAELLGEFREKDYSWQEENDRLILRFASDPGAFPFVQKLTFSHKNLPLKEYEEAICFRKEQRGEVKGLRRVRNFLMTDLHVFCKDVTQLKEEYIELCRLCKQLMDGIIAKGRWVLGWEGTLDFYNNNKAWLLKIVKMLGAPSFFKLMKERSHYYDMKNEFQSVEADGATTQISTVQIDSVNGKRFDICYVDENGKKQPCLIIHCSTFGSIERTLCAILENAAIDEKQGKKPSLPYWLSPTQVRVVPISEKYLKEAIELAEDLNNNKRARADVDDRALHVEKKILEAELEWIPFIVCIGKRELDKQVLTVRVRKSGEIKEFVPHEFKNLLKEEQGEMPYRDLPLSLLLSKRPKFI